MNEIREGKFDLEIILCSTVIISIGQISYMNSSNKLVFVALLICTFFSCFVSSRKLLPLMVCILPANRLLTFGPISAPTIIMLIALLRSAKSFVHIQKTFFFFCSLLITYSTLSLFGENNVFFDSVKIIVMLLFFEKNVDTNHIESLYYRCTLYCALGCIFTSLIALVLNPSSIMETSRFTFSKNGENVLGITCAIITINIFVLLLKKCGNRMMLIILSLLLLGVGFMTGSRSFMIAMAIGIIGIVIMLVLRLQIYSLIKIITLVIFICIGFVFLVRTNSFASEYWNSITYRVTKLQTVDVSNGRFELWKEYINVFHNFPKYLWFGGLSVGTRGIELVAHNMIIEQVASYGIVGSGIIVVLYFYVFIKIIQRSSSCITLRSFRIVPLITMLCVSMVSHTLLGVPQTTMLFICFFAMLDNNEKNVMEV